MLAEYVFLKAPTPQSKAVKWATPNILGASDSAPSLLPKETLWFVLRAHTGLLPLAYHSVVMISLLSLEVLSCLVLAYGLPHRRQSINIWLVTRRV